MPSRAGPRHCGQSAAWSETPRIAVTPSAMSRIFLSVEFRRLSMFRSLFEGIGDFNETRFAAGEAGEGGAERRRLRAEAVRCGRRQRGRDEPCRDDDRWIAGPRGE